jgi:hypothetical protein
MPIMTEALSALGTTATVINGPPAVALEPAADVQPTASKVTARNPSKTRRAVPPALACVRHMGFPPRKGQQRNTVS